ncbi:MAG: glucose/arabinose dehydrogenase [Candidatus Paceibacteria bacterium]|jgi:glucose/arabinose dehydrogenase
MVIISLSLAACCVQLPPTEVALPVEADYYEIVTLVEPEGSPLEISGLAILEDGRPMVATRRGQVWILDNAYTADGKGVKYTLYTDGLQEPLGLLPHDGWIYCTQRGEVSRMRDTDGDDRMDELETVCDAWRISGNYHEYNFGPRLGPDGDLWITTNKPFGKGAFGDVKWRGFAMRIQLDGTMIPECSGLRSPAGLANSPWGDMFYTDNQGEWCGASKLSHLEPGDFHGHPWGIGSCDLPAWPHEIPPAPPDGKTMPVVAESHPTFKLPAVWFPYDKMGQSPAGMCWDTTDGKFGPFAGQLFVTDQHHSSLMRVTLEKVGGAGKVLATPSEKASSAAPCESPGARIIRCSLVKPIEVGVHGEPKLKG